MSNSVWYISKYVIVPKPGDPASRGFGLMRELHRQGFLATIVTSDSMGEFNAPPAVLPYEISKVDGVAICRVRTLKYRTSNSFRRVLSWIHFELRLLRLPLAKLDPPSVIVVSSLSLLTVLNGIRLRRRFRARLVFEVRDIWPLTLTANNSFSMWNPFIASLSAIERLGYRSADAVVGTMPNLAPHVEAVTGRQIPTWCIPQGVDVNAILQPAQLPEDVLAALPTHDAFVVGYAGSIGLSNALDVLLECAELMETEKKVHFLIVGDGGHRQALESRYGHLTNVTFVPRVPRSQVLSLLERCDLLYASVLDSPVYRYGISLNKLIDYMVAGRPIVASYSGYPSMINEARCGEFVPAGNVNALHDALLRYASMSSEDRHELGDRGRRWVLANRSYRALAEQYVKILVPGTDDEVAG